MATRGRPRSFDRSVALERAMEVFWSQGYEGASISDLTAAMGIRAPSLYAAFECKEQLFREAVAHYDATQGQPTERALRDEPTARAAIEAMLRDNAAAFCDPATPLGCMVVLSATSGPPASEAVREHLADNRRGVIRAIEHRIARGITDGDVPRGTDTSVLATFYATVLEGLSIRARDRATLADANAIIDCAMAAWQPLTGAGG